jgi:hypothetical protein
MLSCRNAGAYEVREGARQRELRRVLEEEEARLTEGVARRARSHCRFFFLVFFLYRTLLLLDSTLT